MEDEQLQNARILIAGRLRLARKESGLTFEQLAELSGLGINTVKRMEDARFWPNMRVFLAVCDVLGLTIDLKEKQP
jgi:transcriptional regulator with XRE-family HTH domain